MYIKKLFVLRQWKGGPVIPGPVFNNKMTAKAARDAINANGGQAVVSYGPEHHKMKAKRLEV